MIQPDGRRVARRMAHIQPFQVMALLARARELESAGRLIVHMEVGEPDFPTPASIVEAGRAALAQGHTHYTAALGLPALREAISRYYLEQDGVEVPAERIVVTPGASGALQLALGVLVDPGERVLMADPGYPCNRHLVRLFEGVPVGVPVYASTGYQLSAALLERYGTTETVAAIAATPSNPTGTLIAGSELEGMVAVADARAGRLILDEIYHGLVYGVRARTALALSERLFVVNSFSKYFGMTGWRLGWLVAPPEFMGEIERLAQNIFLAASTPAQHAALAAFRPETLTVLEARRREFELRLEYLVPALRGLGFDIPVEPQGAFYLYADCSRHTDDSFQLSRDLLERAGVAVTPGLDFGLNAPERHLRFSYATSLESLREGVRRIGEFLG
jgi:aspartate/methionine/tyrosine aminotransferase